MSPLLAYALGCVTGPLYVVGGAVLLGALQRRLRERAELHRTIHSPHLTSRFQEQSRNER
jgi:hypothetical protein